MLPPDDPQQKCLGAAGLAARVKQARERAALTQEGLAKLTGLRQFHISRIEHGAIRTINSDTLLRLAQALHVSADYLIGLREETPVLREEPHIAIKHLLEQALQALARVDAKRRIERGEDGFDG